MERMWRERGVIAERGEGVQLHLLRERETEMVLLLWREKGGTCLCFKFCHYERVTYIQDCKPVTLENQATGKIY